ncbi:hypothetical protein BOS5A_211161 [Bosea sp. EC-HK365B]|nr:hypothetical protein BOS5A_211161 [Bosea sp. EC-HK365B]
MIASNRLRLSSFIIRLGGSLAGPEGP